MDQYFTLYIVVQFTDSQCNILFSGPGKEGYPQVNILGNQEVVWGRSPSWPCLRSGARNHVSNHSF